MGSQLIFWFLSGYYFSSQEVGPKSHHSNTFPFFSWIYVPLGPTSTRGPQCACMGNVWTREQIGDNLTKVGRLPSQ